MYSLVKFISPKFKINTNSLNENVHVCNYFELPIAYRKNLD